MKLYVKDMHISTGGTQVVILNRFDAHKLDLHPEDRVLLKKGLRKTIAVVDINETEKVITKGKIGVFEEVLKVMGAEDGDEIHLYMSEKPNSVHYIKKKMLGQELSKKEIYEIVKDVVDNNLTSVELAYFVAAEFMKGSTFEETVNLTEAMIKTGGKLKMDHRIIVDKHSIGGVPGNRTTLIVVPILVAAGLVCPKTSSRSITSPAGTADTVEVFCRVNFQINEVKRIIKKVGGCMIWGGAVNLAPADDKIIRVEHPLSLDPEGQLLASILAKKASVSANHVLIDIPVGKTAKVKDITKADHLAHQFSRIGKEFGMRIEVFISDGSQPIGNGLGPALEAKDVLYVLTNDGRQPPVLREKSLELAGIMLEMAHKALKGRGYEKAKEILDSGKAYGKFVEIIKAQGGSITHPEQINVGEFTYHCLAAKNGIVKEINNKAISKVARIAGAPVDKGAGIYLYKHVHDPVKKGDKLFTIHAESRKKLEYAVKFLGIADGYTIN